MFLWNPTQIQARRVLFAIVLVGAVLRFWGLGSAEFFHDEGLYAFRSIGYVDYIGNNDQTQPIQWFQNEPSVPAWTKLSFHDHPPLFFLTQHISAALFGDTVWAVRLPSAVAGVATILVIYALIYALWGNRFFGLLAAALLAVNRLHIWISRSSLLEALLLLFVFISVWAFVRSLRDESRRGRWLVLWGVALGLSFLTKYTAVFIVPVYIVWIIWGERHLLRNRYLYIGILLAGLIFSPVLIYNWRMYKATGHFDLQIAYLLHQPTPEWKASVGKVQEPFSAVAENLYATYSLPFLLTVATGMAATIFARRRLGSYSPVYAWVVLASAILVTVAVGSAFRFLSLYLLGFIFFALIAWDWIVPAINRTMLMRVALIAYLVYEGFFAIQLIFFNFPNFGIVALDQYLDTTFAGKRSTLLPRSPNPHLEAVITQYGNRYPATSHPLLIVYDENVSLSTRLWLFLRRIYYHGLPAVTTDVFKSLLRTNGTEYFKGYDIYFVKATQYTNLNPYYQNGSAAELETFLDSELKLQPETVIYGSRQLPMFKVYKFTL